jgi:hypothetical protein
MAGRAHSRHRHESANLEIPNGRPLRLAVVADTHSKPHPAAHELIAAEAPDAILHAGDIGVLSVLDELGTLAPVIAVRGNIDGRGVLPDSIDVGVTAGGEVRLRILLTHIAVAGPRLRADAGRLAQQHEASLVVCGHSHVPFIGEDRGMTVFNPGSIGPRRFSLPIVFGMASIGSDGVAFEHISCETRERWSP